MTNLHRIRTQPFACIPIIAIFYHIMTFIGNTLNRVDKNIKDKKYDTVKVQYTDAFGRTKVKYESTAPPAFLLISLIILLIICGQVLSNYALYFLFDTWLIMTVPFYILGFCIQSDDELLERAFTAWKIDENNQLSWPIIAAMLGSLIFTLFIMYFLLLPKFEWVTATFMAIPILVASYYGLCRPLACSLLMTAIYVLFAPRHWQSLAKPMFLLFFIAFYLCYLIYTGQTDDIIFVEYRGQSLSVNLFQLLQVAALWGGFLLFKAFGCYLLFLLFGDYDDGYQFDIYSVLGRFFEVFQFLCGLGILMVFFKLGEIFLSPGFIDGIFNVINHTLLPLTQVLLDQPAVTWLQPLLFWIEMLVCIGVIPALIWHNWVNGLFALAVHLWLLYFISITYNVEKYSTILHGYSEFFMTLFM